jgi:hypothetical protein
MHRPHRKSRHRHRPAVPAQPVSVSSPRRRSGSVRRCAARRRARDRSASRRSRRPTSGRHRRGCPGYGRAHSDRLSSVLSWCHGTLPAPRSPVRRRCSAEAIARRYPCGPLTTVSQAIRRHDSRTLCTSDRSSRSVAWFMTSRHWRSNSATSSGVRASRICAGVASTNGGRPGCGDPADAAVTRETIAGDHDSPERVRQVVVLVHGGGQRRTCCRDRHTTASRAEGLDGSPMICCA